MTKIRKYTAWILIGYTIFFLINKSYPEGFTITAISFMLGMTSLLPMMQYERFHFKNLNLFLGILFIIFTISVFLSFHLLSGYIANTILVIALWASAILLSVKFSNPDSDELIRQYEEQKELQNLNKKKAKLYDEQSYPTKKAKVKTKEAPRATKPTTDTKISKQKPKAILQKKPQNEINVSSNTNQDFNSIQKDHPLHVCKYCGYESKNLTGLTRGSCSNSPSKTHEILEGGPQTKYICKHCGYESKNLKGFTRGNCSNSPSKKHQPYEGGIRNEYFCKHCGYRSKRLTGLTRGTCTKSPTNNHQPLF